MRCVAIFLAVLGLFLTGCPDDVDTTYSTTTHARDDGLFDSGLLPDMLPPSAYNIHIVSHSDVNEVQGEFSFAATDYVRFAAQFDSFFQPFEYSADGHTWVFCCDPAAGHCNYFMR